MFYYRVVPIGYFGDCSCDKILSISVSIDSIMYKFSPIILQILLIGKNFWKANDMALLIVSIMHLL